MTKRTQPITSILAHNSINESNKIEKVIAEVIEVPVEPDHMYIVACPYCHAIKKDIIFEENCTIKVTCFDCEKYFKVKIPKFY